MARADVAGRRDAHALRRPPVSGTLGEDCTIQTHKIPMA